MIGEGNQAYIDGDTANAMQIMQEVILMYMRLNLRS